MLFTGSRQQFLPSTSFLFFVLQLSAFVHSGLQKLLLQDNQLSQLPEDLASLQQLEVVLVDGNPMTDPPIEVCCQGTSAILEYLQEKKHKKAMALKVPVLRKQPQMHTHSSRFSNQILCRTTYRASAQHQKHLKTLFASATVKPYF